MILAGKTIDITFADGNVVRCTPTNSDEVRFERLAKTSLTRVLTDDAVPLWVLLGIVHVRLQRDGVNVPADVDDFADLLAEMWLEVVDEGKAEGSAPTPGTG